MSTAAKTPNYNLSQVAGSDIPDWITDYTSDMSKIDAALKENADDIATVRPDEFSEESTYAAGDYCIKDNVIYKAKTAVEAGAFDVSDWTATTIFDELSELNQNMNGVFSVSSSDLVDGTQNVEFPWSSYLLLSFSVNNYSNYGQSSVILSSVFNEMSATRRVILSYNAMSIEIYPNGNNSITIKANGDIDNNIVVKITGIINL